MRYRFGDHELDVEGFRLLRAGVPVAVEPRVFELLAYLVRNADRLVSREELLAEVWQGQVVAEGALAQAVHSARGALGESSQAPERIHTVHGRGYRFAGPVEQLEAGSKGVAPIGVEVPPLRRRRLGVAGAGLLALVGVFSWWWWQGRAPPSTEAGTTSDRLSTVALLPLVNATGDADLAWVELGLADLVARRIETTGAVSLVPLTEIVGLTRGGDADPRSLARQTGAEWFVSGVVTRDDGAYRIRATLTSAGRPPRSEMFAGSDVFSVAHAMAGAVVGWIGNAAIPAAGRPRPESTADALAQQAFAQGVNEQLQGRPAEAVRFFELALERAPDLLEARYELAIAVRRLGRREAAEELGQAVLREAQAKAMVQLEAKAHNHLGILYRSSGETDRARRHFESSWRLHKQLGHRRAEASNHINLGILDTDQAQFESARSHYDSALEITTALADRRGQATVFNSLGVLAWNQGDVEESGRMHERALKLRRELGDLRNEAASLNNLGTVARALGRFEEAEDLFHQGLAIRRDLGDRPGVASSLTTLASVAMDLGRWAQSEEFSREALAMSAELGLPRQEAYAAAGLADLETARRRWDEAARRSRQALARFVEIGDRRRVAAELARLIELELAQGRVHGVEAALADVRAAATELAAEDLAVQARVIEGRAALLRGATAAAITAFGDALEMARRTRSSATEARLSIEAAEWLAERGAVAEAERMLADLGARWDEWWRTHWSRSRVALAAGDVERALAAAERARELAGEAWGAEEQRHLESLGPLAPQPLPSSVPVPGPGSLIPGPRSPVPGPTSDALPFR